MAANISEDIRKQVTDVRGQYETASQQLNVPVVKFSAQRSSPGADSRMATFGLIRQVAGQQKKAQREIGVASEEFESTVAKDIPELGKAEYVEREYSSAASKLQEQAKAWEDRIKNAREKIDYYREKERTKNRDYGDRIDSYEDDIQVYEQRLRAYKEFLGKDKADAIRGVNTGYVDKLSNYYGDKEQSSIDARNSYYNALNNPNSDISKALKQLQEGKYISSDKPGYAEFTSAIGKFNKDASYNKQIVDWGNKVGSANLPDFAKSIYKSQTQIEIPKEYTSPAAQRFYLESKGIEVSPYGPLNNIVAVDLNKAVTPTSTNVSYTNLLSSSPNINTNINVNNSMNKVLGAGGGTYSYETNTYTDKLGNKFSTASAPAGSLVLGGISSITLGGKTITLPEVNETRKSVNVVPTLTKFTEDYLSRLTPTNIIKSLPGQSILEGSIKAASGKQTTTDVLSGISRQVSLVDINKAISTTRDIGKVAAAGLSTVYSDLLVPAVTKVTETASRIYEAGEYTRPATTIPTYMRQTVITNVEGSPTLSPYGELLNMNVPKVVTASPTSIVIPETKGNIYADIAKTGASVIGGVYSGLNYLGGKAVEGVSKLSNIELGETPMWIRTAGTKAELDLTTGEYKLKENKAVTGLVSAGRWLSGTSGEKVTVGDVLGLNKASDIIKAAGKGFNILGGITGAEAMMSYEDTGYIAESYPGIFGRLTARGIIGSEQEDIQKRLSAIAPIEEKLSKASIEVELAAKDYEAGNITEKEYMDIYSSYDNTRKELEANPDYQYIQSRGGIRSSLLTRAAESEMSKTGKFALNFLSSAGRTVPYIASPSYFFAEKSTGIASNIQEGKLSSAAIGAGEIALFSMMGRGGKVGTQGAIGTSKATLLSTTKALTIPSIFSVGSGIATYKQTGDIASALGSATGTFTVFTAPKAISYLSERPIYRTNVGLREFRKIHGYEPVKVLDFKPGSKVTVGPSRLQRIWSSFTETPAKDLYSGVYFKDAKGYQASLKYLTRRGFTESEAKQYLRFVNPTYRPETSKSVSLQDSLNLGGYQSAKTYLTERLASEKISSGLSPEAAKKAAIKEAKDILKFETTPNKLTSYFETPGKVEVTLRDPFTKRIKQVQKYDTRLYTVQRTSLAKEDTSLISEDLIKQKVLSESKIALISEPSTFRKGGKLITTQYVGGGTGKGEFEVFTKSQPSTEPGKDLETQFVLGKGYTRTEMFDLANVGKAQPYKLIKTKYGSANIRTYIEGEGKPFTKITTLPERTNTLSNVIFISGKRVPAQKEILGLQTYGKLIYSKGATVSETIKGSKLVTYKRDGKAVQFLRGYKGTESTKDISKDSGRTYTVEKIDKRDGLYVSEQPVPRSEIPKAKPETKVEIKVYTIQTPTTVVKPTKIESNIITKPLEGAVGEFAEQKAVKPISAPKQVKVDVVSKEPFYVGGTGRLEETILTSEAPIKGAYTITESTTGPLSIKQLVVSKPGLEYGKAEDNIIIINKKESLLLNNLLIGELSKKKMLENDQIQIMINENLFQKAANALTKVQQKSEQKLDTKLAQTQLAVVKTPNVAVTTPIRPMATPSKAPRPKPLPKEPKELVPMDLDLGAKRIRPSEAEKQTYPTGYKVSVRRRGRFIEETPYTLTKEEAIALGIRKTKTSAAATFRLTESAGKVKTLGISAPTGLLKEYRMAKGKKAQGLTFVQKEPLRLMTSGEKREVTKVGTSTAARLKRLKSRSLSAVSRVVSTTFKKPRSSKSITGGKRWL